MKKYGFIGCGNMGGALAVSVAKAVGGENVYGSDFDMSKVEVLSAEYGINVSSNEFIAQSCDYIYLGAKPQALLSELLPSMKNILDSRSNDFCLVSMAAGISIEKIEAMVGKRPIIRIMPNTPAAVGSGMVLYSPNSYTSQEQVECFVKAMHMSGELDNIPEKLIDAASAVSGCGPAFVYLFIEALADGGVNCGLPRDKAMLYAAQTVKGAADTVLATGKHPGALKDAVCSPGGTTIEGVRALENGGFRANAMEAVIAAYEKTLKLAK